MLLGVPILKHFRVNWVIGNNRIISIFYCLDIIAASRMGGGCGAGAFILGFTRHASRQL